KRHLQTVTALKQVISPRSVGSMPREKLPAPGWYGWRRRILAGMLALIAVTACGLWLRGNVFTWHDAQIVRHTLDAGRLDEASRALERWLRKSPDSAEAHYLKARVAWIQNDLPTVDAELARAQSLGYAWQAVARLKGLLLARGNQFSQAVPLLRQALDGSL